MSHSRVETQAVRGPLDMRNPAELGLSASPVSSSGSSTRAVGVIGAVGVLGDIHGDVPGDFHSDVHGATRGEYSDAEIAQRVRSFLTSRHFPTFRQLHVDVHNGSVCLQGKVHSYYEKQVALNSCQRVAGVLNLIDQVLVELDEEFGPSRREEVKPR